MLLYVAGPYTAPTEEGVQANIDKASDVSAELWNMGHAVICPHKNTGNFHNVVPNLKHEDWLKGDKQMIAVCDGIVFLPGWENSPGSCEEMDYARSVGMTDNPKEGPITIWYAPDLPELHLTEVNSPIQVKAFREEVGKMHRTHLSKNADYSPANIAGPGWDGIVTRLWDKQTRLMNLTGFKILIGELSWFDRIVSWFTGAKNTFVIKDIVRTSPKTPKHESIDDTLDDNAVYSKIGKLYRQGKWGK